MGRRLPRLGTGPVLIACLIVVLGTTMIPAFAAEPGNPTDTTEQSGTNCGCGPSDDSDVVDIDGNNNTVKIIINGDSGATGGSVVGEGTGDDTGSDGTTGGGDGAGSSASNPSASTQTGESATVDVSVENGDVRVNGEDVANEDEDGMSNDEAKRIVNRIVNNVDGDTTVTTEDITRIVNENDINGGDTGGINVTAVAEAINAANDDGGNAGTPPDTGGETTGTNGGETTTDTGGETTTESGTETETPTTGTGDNNEQTASDIDNSTVLQYLLDQEFIDRSELNAAIENNSIDNSTILANIVNGDQTINVDSRYIDNSVTIDDSTTITQIIQNSTVVNDSDNASVRNGGTTTTGTTTAGTTTGTTTTGTTTTGTTTTGGGMAAPDIGVTKSTDADQVEVSLLEQGGILQANEPATFTVTVTNSGDATANDVVVNDDDVIADIANNDILDTTVFLVTDSSTSQGDFSAATGDFEVGTLAPGESATLTFDALAVSTDAGLLDGSLAELNATNNAEVVADSVSEDSNADNDMGSATVTLVSALDLGNSSGLSDDQLAALNDAFTDAQVSDLQDQLTTDQLVTLLDATSDEELASIGDALNSDSTTIEAIGDAIDGDNLDGFLDGLLDTAGPTTSETTVGPASTTGQSGLAPISPSDLAVGGITLVGLLGSALLFKRE